jgi:hypothetical protein
LWMLSMVSGWWRGEHYFWWWFGLVFGGRRLLS